MKGRVASLDLLKILAVFLIVCFHASYKGVPATIIHDTNFVNRSLYYFFYHLGELGVNLFMLITGFFLVNSQQVKKTKIIKLIIDVYFFSILSILLTILIGKYTFHLQDLFPISFSYYWYITAYLIIYILSPFINKFVKDLPKKEFQKLLVILFVMLSLIPNLAGLIIGSTEELGFYNRFIWLFFVYLVGGYLSLYQDKLSILKSSPRKTLFRLLGLFIFTSAFVLLASYIKINTRFFNIPPTYFWGPNSIVIFPASILLFSLFYRLKVPPHKSISTLSSATLSVYLLHEHPKFCFALWFDIIPLSSFYYSKKLYPVIIAVSFAIIIIGTLIHQLKKSTFDQVIDRILLKLDRKNYEKTH